MKFGEQVLQTVEQELKKKIGTQLVIHSAEPLGGGCINHVCRLATNQGNFLLKWQLTDFEDLFIREAECLTALRERVEGQLVIPSVVAAREGGATPGFLVTEFLVRGQVRHQEEKLGAGLAHLHRYSDCLFGFDHRNFCGATPQDNRRKTNWADFFRTNRLQTILGRIDHDRPLKGPRRACFDRFLEKLPGLLPVESRPSLIHGDLWSGNYLYTTSGPALIDPASAWCDREMELALMRLFGGFSSLSMEAYQNAFPLVQGWQERVKIYQLYHLLNHYYLFGGFYGEEAYATIRGYL